MMNDNKSHSQFSTLDEWLSYLETIHSTEIELGLTRIGQVADALAIDLIASKVITVAGTNGKGTTCAFLENAFLSEGKSVAVYSSPHIEHFNERLRINKTNIDDASLINAFEKIEQARQQISLSYYEYTTLAALLVLMSVKPDVIILEVGLGGRLDATNIIDADIAVITTIDLDHQAFLGNDRETIGYEKAGIMRANRLSIIGDYNAPLSVIEHGHKIGSRMLIRERDYLVDSQSLSWQWQFNAQVLDNLEFPHIPLDNVATALMVLSALKFNLTSSIVNNLIAETKVPGRTEMFRRHCDIMLDVGHNPQATRYLAQAIKKRGYKSVHAVVGMLVDKDISSSLAAMQDVVEQWYFTGLPVARAANAVDIADKAKSFTTSFNCFDNAPQAFTMACENAQATDLVVVFGSFFTVAEVRRLLI